MANRAEAYRTKGNVLDDNFFNDRFLDINLRLVALEESTQQLDAIRDQLVERGLQQLADQVSAAVASINSQVATALESFDARADDVEALVATLNGAVAAVQEQIDEILENEGLTASTISINPIAGIAGDTVQEALEEHQASLALRAPLASPPLTGTPTAPTASVGTNTTQLATTAFVLAEIAALIASAPGALNTLDELAAAMGDDANFAATMTTALAGKQGIHAMLTALSALSTAANKGLYFTGENVPATFDLHADGRALVGMAYSAMRTALGLVPGTDVQAFDADTLKSDVTRSLTAGYTAAGYDAGTKSSATFTPDMALGNLQKAVNGGAHTLAVPAANGSMTLQYTNNGSAGAITPSGFTRVFGDTPTTVNGDDYVGTIWRHGSFSFLCWANLQ